MLIGYPNFRTQNETGHRRWALHAAILVCAAAGIGTGFGNVQIADAPARPSPVSPAIEVGVEPLAPPDLGADDIFSIGRLSQAEAAGTLAMRPLDPLAPAVPSTGAPAPSQRRWLEDEQPVVTVAAPVWLKSTVASSLWAAPTKDAPAFTDLPVGSLLRVEGPPVDGRWPVYYMGDGLYRRPGPAWVDVAVVQGFEAPAPGEIAAVDAYAARPLPEWVQVHQLATLWSGPDERAVLLTDLPQWTFLKVAGVARSGRLLVEYAGDYATRQSGIGWVDETKVGPSGDPGRWVQNHRPSALFSGADDSAIRFTDVPQWSKLRVVDEATAKDRLLVEFFGDGGTRKPGLAWIPRSDVGPVTPPVPLPASLGGAGAASEPASGAQRPVQSRTFGSQTEFIETVGEAARRSQQRTGVPASVTIAQAILESDWGRSALTRRANNLFGIKAFGVPGTAGIISLRTWEHVDGSDIVVQAGFKAYTTLDDSVDDHGRFFLRNRRYAPAMAVANDSKQFAWKIQEAGYATDPSYAPKLIRLMDRYNLYRFDVAAP